MYRPIQWARQSAQGRQVENDGSRLINFYAVGAVDPTESKVPVLLYSLPGMRRFLEVPPRLLTSPAITPPAGIHALLESNTPAYGYRLFGISSRYDFFALRQGGGAGVQDIAEGYDPLKDTAPDDVFEVTDLHQFTGESAEAVPEDEPAKLVTDGRRIMWVSPNEVFCYDLGKAGGAGFVDIQAPEPSDRSPLEDLNDQEWVGIEWIDGYFIIAARSGDIFHSALDLITFDQLDFGRASSSPDAIVGLAKLNRRLYVLGTHTVEDWFNTGNADFAFSRNNSTVIQLGCIARHSIASNEFGIMFLAHDLIVYMISGPGHAIRISSTAVEYDIAQSEFTKARAYTYTEEGHRFYSLTLFFPDGTKKNWTFDFKTNFWHERTTTDILATARFNGRNIVGRAGNQHIYDMRLDWGYIEADDDGEDDIAIDRTAISPILFANLHRVRVGNLQLDIPPRPGEDDDSVLLEWSDDGGQTWVGEFLADGVTSAARELGTRQRHRWNRLGQTSRDGSLGRNFRLTTSAMRRVDILGAYIEFALSKN